MSASKALAAATSLGTSADAFSTRCSRQGRYGPGDSSCTASVFCRGWARAAQRHCCHEAEARGTSPGVVGSASIGSRGRARSSQMASCSARVRTGPGPMSGSSWGGSGTARGCASVAQAFNCSEAVRQIASAAAAAAAASRPRAGSKSSPRSRRVFSKTLCRRGTARSEHLLCCSYSRRNCSRQAEASPDLVEERLLLETAVLPQLFVAAPPGPTVPSDVDRARRRPAAGRLARQDCSVTLQPLSAVNIFGQAPPLT
mmetsp:Transcript_59715/g.129353  ORF Transcript_59715/g.129353 Transcript_59715/m.129353 type:complete len:257 (+) Transcript_59715:536-1306(+)